jgi:ADP-heptose:LPS heptosyltransferase
VTFPSPLPSPLRGRYLVHNPGWNAFLGLADRLLAVGTSTESPPIPREPRRVLLAVGGHLGDAVIVTSAVALLRRGLPQAEIGIVLGSWARAAIDGHPGVRWIHTVDHWKGNRSPTSLAKKWMRYRATTRRALKEIRGVGYDVAVDLYMYYPNMATLLWRAGIPVRVGYTSGGYGPLYTHPVDWQDSEEHTAEQQAKMLRVLVPALADTPVGGYELAPVAATAERQAGTVLSANGLQRGEYVVVHIGSGSPLREWPASKWRELAKRLTAEGYRLAFTGSGDEQARAIAQVTQGLRGCADLCNRLRWPEFVSVVAGAALLVGVETVAAHVAAAVGTPSVALWTGIGRLSHWRPLAAQCTVLMSAVPCAPCFRSRGCSAMACVRDVTVDTVLDAVRARVQPPGAPKTEYAAHGGSRSS